MASNPNTTTRDPVDPARADTDFLDMLADFNITDEIEAKPPVEIRVVVQDDEDWEIPHSSDVNWKELWAGVTIGPSPTRVKRKSGEVLNKNEDLEQQPPLKLSAVDGEVAHEILDEQGYFKKAEDETEAMELTDSVVVTEAETQAPTQPEPCNSGFLAVPSAQGGEVTVPTSPNRIKIARRRLSNSPRKPESLGLSVGLTLSPRKLDF